MNTLTNPTQSPPPNPQFQLGATAGEAKEAAKVSTNQLPGPGGIVARLENQQWNLPRNDNPNAETQAHISRDLHGED